MLFDGLRLQNIPFGYSQNEAYRNVTMSESSTVPHGGRSIAWLRYLRIGVAVVLLVYLLSTIAWSQFFSAIANVRLPLVGLAFLLSTASVASKAKRWGIALKSRGITASDRYLLVSYLVSMFFNNFLPSGMGGDAVRA